MKLLTTGKLCCIAIAAAASLSGCVVQPVRPPRPQPVVEVLPPAPAPGYHWVQGYYRWHGDRWVWRRGHWVPN